MRLAITSRRQTPTELRIEDVFDAAWRVIGGRQAFFYRRKKPNYGSTSLGCWSIWKREG